MNIYFLAWKNPNSPSALEMRDVLERLLAAGFPQKHQNRAIINDLPATAPEPGNY
ncbi:hypothetical protein [Pseudomonas sp. CFBP 5748]|nr:hypothetical protein [uncultured Pseudomonas sp.]